MFKSTLIENHNYFKYKKIAFILMFLSSAFMSLSSQLRSLALVWWVLIIALLIITRYYHSKFQSLVNILSTNREIEIDTEEIRIISKNKTNESFRLNEIDKVIVKDDYSMKTDDKVKVFNEFTGLISDNFIFIKNDGKMDRYEFVMPSHYMKKEINIIIDSWKAKGFNVETISKKS